MRVVHVATGFLPVSPTSGRSVERNLHQLTKNQAQPDGDIEVIDIKAGSHLRSETGARFHELWTPPLSGANLFSYSLKVITFTLQLLPVLRRLAKSGGADIIHTHSQFPAAAILLARRLFGWKIPVVYTAHNPYLLMPPSLANKLKHLLIEDKVLRRVDRVVAQTEAVGRELSLRFNIEPAKIRQVYDGIDIEAIDDFMGKYPRQADPQKIVFYPAVINPRKNQMAIIEGIPQVLKACPECKFIFAGAVDDTAYFNIIQRSVLEHGLSPWVEFPGRLSTEPLYRLYRDATIFVFPTLYESQGVVLVEAMAFGLPVIASRIGPLLDVVSLEEGSALLIDPYNAEEIAQAIIKLLQDEPLRNKLSAKGRKLASSRFPWSRVAEDMLAMYKELVPGKGINND